MNIIFHTGDWKTGTTSIQAFLATNREQLLAQGFCYPGNKRQHFFPKYWRKSLTEAQEYLDTLIAEGVQAQAHTLILSSEGSLGLVPFLDFRGHSVRIIHYMRLFPSHNESGLAQHIKTYGTGWRGLRFRRCTFYNTISRTDTPISSMDRHFIMLYGHRPSAGSLIQLRQALSHYSVQIFSYETAHQYGLIRHFTEQAGIEELIQSGEDIPEYNVTLCTASLFFLAQCNLLPFDASFYKKLRRHLTESAVTTDTTRYLLVSPEQYRHWIDEDREALQEIGEMLGDPEWPEKCLAWLEGKQEVPYESLPVHLQHEIFSNLPADLQKTIKEAWPLARFAGKNDPLLPSMPDSDEMQFCIERWSAMSLKELDSIRDIIGSSAALNAEIEALRNSLSWRITAPLRRIGAFLPHFLIAMSLSSDYCQLICFG